MPDEFKLDDSISTFDAYKMYIASKPWVKDNYTCIPSRNQIGFKTLFICGIEDGKCITHDGYMQLGFHCHSVERHLQLCSKINWIVVHWIPDVLQKRYPRCNYQNHLEVSSGKNTIEQTN